jgi:serine/threonine protein kinase
MTLASGSRLGPYEVLSAIGAGGMGEVYKARDTQLNRDVAIKTLPESLAADHDRLARLRREARVLASLNHPNIAQIYGLERQEGWEGRGGTDFLVMELVPGEELAQRIARGPMPLSEALPIARQIADALAAAHEQGIIHRDLKPANIKVRDDGAVKVLDFGLAKAIGDLSGSFRPQPDPTLSPTITSPLGMTALGVILGTAAYMAPEQAAGKAADKRSDLWAFGAVLYEMLTGRAPFSGESVSHVLAAVLTQDPDWDALPRNCPQSLVRLLHRCLERNPKDRLDSATATRLDIDDTLTRWREGTSDSPALVRSTGWRRVLPFAAAAAIVITVGAAVALWPERSPAPTVDYPYRFTMSPPGKEQFLPAGGFSGETAPQLAVSPDGSSIVFVTIDGARRSLWIHELNGSAARRLTELEYIGFGGSVLPFWSPDSQWIAFSDGGKLRKVRSLGGPSQVICDMPAVRGGTWSQHGTIIFSNADTLFSVSENGGMPSPLSTVAESQLIERWPFFLPDGNRFVYWSVREDGTPGIYLGSLDAIERTRLLDATNAAQYASGHLLFVRGRTLMAQLFDPSTLRVAGNAMVVEEPVGASANGYAAFSVASRGVLVTGNREAAPRQIVRVDRAGMELQRVSSGTYGHVDLSRNELHIVGTRTEPASQRRAVIALNNTRGTEARIVFGGDPRVNGDGQWVAFNLDTAAAPTQALQGLYRVRTDAERPPEQLAGGQPYWPTDWSSDGRFILVMHNNALRSIRDLNPQTYFDVSVYDSVEGGALQPFAITTASEAQARFSPNQQWIAYTSDESGRFEVYLRPFKGSGDKVRVSPTGGVEPKWGTDGRVLFYLSGSDVMAVDVEEGNGTITTGPPRALFRARLGAVDGIFGSRYAPMNNGREFLINQIIGDEIERPLSVVVNWLAALKP